MQNCKVKEEENSKMEEIISKSKLQRFQVLFERKKLISVSLRIVKTHFSIVKDDARLQKKMRENIVIK